MKTRIISIASGKGGVGKSFVTLNLAVELAVQRKKVLLIDADVGLGNIHILVGKNPKYSIADLMEGNCKLEDSLMELVKGNLKILAGGTGFKKMFHMSKEKRSNLFKELKKIQNKFDIVLIDIGAGINKDVISFLELGDEVILVTNPDITAVADAYSLLKSIVNVHTITKNIGVIINKADIDLGEKVFEKLKNVSEKFLKTKLKHIGSIDENRKMAYDSTQKRLPIYYLSPSSKFRKEFYNLSVKIFYNKELHDSKNVSIVTKFMRFLGVDG
ncbi:AAA family ATPase [Haliovirga abyssi]|uniref:Site-determining protein n=1 Tax=Haliovirga abyssi TaxID=2996794 RepID=A0AAU9D9N5_9FUSO|nr:AAA family ATPase [Haliovirga abyssi]BDU50020.1 site-determining protein [Haliovirga abyssi]